MVKNCWNINGYESKTHNPQYDKRHLTYFKEKTDKEKKHFSFFLWYKELMLQIYKQNL